MIYLRSCKTFFYSEEKKECNLKNIFEYFFCPEWIWFFFVLVVVAVGFIKTMESFVMNGFYNLRSDKNDTYCSYSRSFLSWFSVPNNVDLSSGPSISGSSIFPGRFLRDNLNKNSSTRDDRQRSPTRTPKILKIVFNIGRVNPVPWNKEN